ncbi:MAG: hypothetical protein ACK5O1_02750 [Holosporales bacterium]|jgi:hypothetical protein
MDTQKKSIAKWAIIGFVAILIFGIIQQIIGFNNKMIALQEMKKAEIETTKVEYGQCIVKITETNQIAKAYRDDIMALATKAGSNLEQLNKSLMALMGTQVIPQMPPDLRAVVQKEILSCRNAYTGRIDLSLKPMYVNFNRLQRQFPYSLYNRLFFDWQPEELSMPKNEAGQEIFDTGRIKPLDLQ